MAGAAQTFCEQRPTCHTPRPSVADVPTDLRRHLGRLGEDLALAHLQRLGYTLVTRNYRTRHGEIDLVVCERGILVFVEVKTRRASVAGRGPWESLHARKQERVRRMAAQFLAEVDDRPWSPELRFDAIGIVIDARGQLVRLDHLEDAF
ncbi:MAG: putative endonuclease [Solirubrobacteraceae bacterium]|nr:putative endonuclease [Solirubrobacteraceae bacterium]